MPDNKEMYYVGFCRICKTGALGLRECGRCGEVVVLCDECDSMWTNADFSVKPNVGNEHDLPCPYCEASLTQAPSRWAHKSKIDKLAWLQTALQSEDLEVRTGQGFSDPEQPEK